ncbi:hypothetical protein [Nitrosomonas sp. Nm166]|uniref:hypothetical protein n=1 Tax=Nitrosomonas sp. Nm166 TaxID=1881054 RepID=UPI0008F0D2E7|nr:hypothetical protein [Nitrosomonas sp. Nm166]SFD86981.1 hypothetical protein SAMN05428977_1001124 [Nitrosomonas sp. Nm166]
MSNTISAKDLIRVEERLRQVRETFDQRKKQDAQWFVLRLCMGCIAGIMLPLIGIGCFYILVNHTSFPETIITSAGAALLTDILGLMIAVWKVVINPKSAMKLEPISDLYDHNL